MQPDQNRPAAPAADQSDTKTGADAEAGLSDGELDRVSAGLSLLDGGAVLPVDSTSELLNLGKLVEGKDLLAQVRPGSLKLDLLNHQSRDMD